MVKNIAVILARGGSKRLPRKNILEVNNKPMIAWTIIAAIQSEKFHRVLVSTDDPEIAEIAKRYGADVPFLRVTAADDITPSSEATLVALEQAELYWNESYDVVTQLMSNCPLRNKEDIEHATDNFFHNNIDSQISCFRFGWMNPWWAAELNEEKEPSHAFPEAMKKRSQDLPPLYCPTGAIWIAKTSILRTAKTFYGGKYIFHPLNWISALDIDDEDDLEMAKACFLLKEQNR